ncbi:MAG: hypothetical protein HND52_20675, partial [Ignavibacteriae bacterium]|nr:hypothetical protein [Ignavibacteriota bacterium]MBL1215796.1 hypothetical protein [Ignavibacteriota bacterium]NOG99523.1 hypothetical protein [Ignavibacteriota bacterium]NOH00387.1 hypothetical protein [Ignavibacteriota bacterium]
EEKFPILGDIPLLGLLFKSVNEQISKSELIIYLTPRIMYNDNYEYLYYNYSENR